MKLTLSSKSMKAKMAAKHDIEPTGFWSSELYSQKDWTLIEKKGGKIDQSQSRICAAGRPLQTLANRRFIFELFIF